MNRDDVNDIGCAELWPIASEWVFGSLTPESFLGFGPAPQKALVEICLCTPSSERR